jgi:putative ABC transport system ATP-binding protein
VQTLSPGARAHLRLCHLGFVLQQNSLLPHFSLRENIALPAWRLSGSRSLALAQADEWLQRLGLSEVAHQPAGLCSPGEAQRGAVARAVINNPRLVLADEPTGNLDAATGQQIIDMMFDLNASQGTTLVLVTHDEAIAARCARLLRIHCGRLA